MEEYLKSGGGDKCELHKYLADQIIKEWKKYTDLDLDEVKRRYIAKVCNNSNTSNASKGKLF